MKVSKITLGMLLLILPFMIPDSLIRIGSVGTVVRLWKIGVGAWGVLYACKKRKVSLLLVVLSLFHITIFISGMIHGRTSIDWLMYLALVWVVDFATGEERRRIKFFHLIINIGGLFIIINLISMLLFPDGLYSTAAYDLNWFLGYKNGIIRKSLPVLILLFVNALINNRNLNKKEWIILIATGVSIIMSVSLNCYIGLLVFLVFAVLGYLGKLPKWVKLPVIFILYSVVDFVWVNTNIVTQFEHLISLLGKHASASGRVAIWERTLELIKQSPVYGYGGIQSSMYRFSFDISHPHNLLLYYFMLGGIIAVFLFFLTLCIVNNQMKKNTSDMAMMKINDIFIASYSAYFVMGLSESLIGAVFFIPFLVVVYNMNKDRSHMDDRTLYAL